jgi:hypothetical protein
VAPPEEKGTEKQEGKAGSEDAVGGIDIYN